MTVDSMVAQAEKSLGVGEPNYLQRWYAPVAFSSNWAWCNIAITYWAYHSGNSAPVCFGGKYAYTVSHANRFKAAGQWHTDVAGIRRGDILFFDWGFTNQINAIDHVGLVTGVRADGAVLTIEGNTSNVCARRVRRANVIAGYGRPLYAKPAPTPSPPKPAIKEWVWEAGPWNDHQVTNSTRIVQRALNKEFPAAPLAVDGRFAEKSRSKYRLWQTKLGYTGSDADGIPGPTSLRKLGAKYGFDIRKP